MGNETNCSTNQMARKPMNVNKKNHNYNKMFRVGEKILGRVGKPETHNFFFFFFAYVPFVKVMLNFWRIVY